MSHTHPYTNDTLIHLDIQAEDKAEIIQCVVDTFPYMEGWKVDTAVAEAMLNYPQSRFYSFNLTQKLFQWWRKNESYSDTQDCDEVVIKDLADISYLLQFVYDNAEELRKNLDMGHAFNQLFGTPVGIIDSIASTQTNPCGEQKKKRKKDANANGNVYGGKLDLHKLYKKLQEAQEKMWATKYEDQWITIAPPQKYYYNDYMTSSGGKSMMHNVTYKVKLSNLPKDICLDDYDHYKQKALSPSTTIQELNGIIQKIAGLHGSMAEEIRKLCLQAINLIKKDLAAQKQAEKDAKDAAQGALGSWKAFQQAAQKKWNAKDDPYKDAVIKFIPPKKEEMKLWYTKPKSYSSDKYTYTYNPKAWYSEYQSTWDDSTDY